MLGAVEMEIALSGAGLARAASCALPGSPGRMPGLKGVTNAFFILLIGVMRRGVVPKFRLGVKVVPDADPAKREDGVNEDGLGVEVDRTGVTGTDGR